MDGTNNRLTNSNHLNNRPNSDNDDEDIPSCLIVACVPDTVFHSSEEDRSAFENKFTQFGNAGFVYLKSFRRVLVNYESPMSAAIAKLALHFTEFKEQELKVYFKKVS